MRIFLAIMLLAAVPALADDNVPPVRDPLVLKECGSCHMAFQPALLPAAAWTRMMDGLGDHFGEDASLPADKARHIRDYLSGHAGRRGDGQVLRITETRWFTHEHRFPERAWKDPKVVTKSNCPACHRGADQGIYEDD